MSDIFNYLDYRKLIKDRVKLSKKGQRGWTLQRLAERAAIQPPYLTNVLKERAHLNSDQLYNVSKNLGLNSEEIRFSLLLLDWERSANEERRTNLKNEIEAIRKQKLKTETHLKAEKVDPSLEDLTRFYINPELQLVYAFLGIEKYAGDLKLIAERLGIAVEQVQEYVAELKDLGMVQVAHKGVEKTKKRLHLPKDSALCSPQQMLMHYRALQHLQQLPGGEKYNFMVTFTADEETRERVQQEFMMFLGKIEQLVKEAPSKEVYQMHFDLFSWSFKK